MIRGIGIFGGTFDPLHVGHLRVAHAALDELHLARVDFVPAGDPWQKQDVSSGYHRLAMLRIGVEYDPRFTVNTCELERVGPTYTVETLREMRRIVGEAMPLVLIIGDDQWANFHTWREWEAILDLVHVAHVARDDASRDPAPAVLSAFAGRECASDELTLTAFGRVCRFSMPASAAKSALVRRWVRDLSFAEAMRRADGWISSEVAEYILRHGLYGAHR